MYYYSFDIDKWVKRTNHLLPEEEGIYLRLINRYYDTQEPLTLDLHALARSLRLTAYRETMEQILREFFTETPDGYTNEKCDRNIAEYARKGAISRANGRKGGRPRGEKNPGETREEPSKNPGETQQVIPGVPSKNPGHNLNEPESVNLQICKPAQEEQGAAVATPEWLNTSAWAEFVQHRKEMRKPLSPLAKTKAINQLEGLTMDQQQLVIDTSIQARWAGLFTDKIRGNNGANQGSTTGRKESHAQWVSRRLQEEITKSG